MKDFALSVNQGSLPEFILGILQKFLQELILDNSLEVLAEIHSRNPHCDSSGIAGEISPVAALGIFSGTSSATYPEILVSFLPFILLNEHFQRSSKLFRGFLQEPLQEVLQ